MVGGKYYDQLVKLFSANVGDNVESAIPHHVKRPQEQVKVNL